MLVFSIPICDLSLSKHQCRYIAWKNACRGVFLFFYPTFAKIKGYCNPFSLLLSHYRSKNDKYIVSKRKAGVPSPASQRYVVCVTLSSLGAMYIAMFSQENTAIWKYAVRGPLRCTSLIKKKGNRKVSLWKNKWLGSIKGYTHKYQRKAALING